MAKPYKEQAQIKRRPHRSPKSQYIFHFTRQPATPRLTFKTRESRRAVTSRWMGGTGGTYWYPVAPHE